MYTYLSTRSLPASKPKPRASPPKVDPTHGLKQCLVCEGLFPSEEALERHKRKWHTSVKVTDLIDRIPVPTPKIPAKVVVNCKICNKVKFTFKLALLICLFVL